MGVLDGWLSSMGNGSFGVEFGHPIVTHGDLVTRLFPNYFGQYSFIVKIVHTVHIK